MKDTGSVMRFPFEQPPSGTEAIEVAQGVLWLRQPLPMALDHVNIYVLDEGDSWTVVDTGFYSKKALTLWQAWLEGPLAGKPVGRVVVTHHHPDHVGLAGWFQSEHGAELVTSRTAWLFARMLQLDEQPRPTQETMAFWRSCGMSDDILAKRAQERPMNFADCVYPMPLGFTRVKQGDQITMGGRAWDVHMGNGHAPEQLTLWSRDDNLVLSGDQILSSISPNIGTYATEPQADPVADWLEACERLSTLAREDHLVLGGHKLPFQGLPARMRHLIDNHHSALTRLEAHLNTPKSATECFAPLFKRTIGDGEYGLAMVEAMSHCLHLWHTGRASREMDSSGTWRFCTLPQ